MGQNTTPQNGTQFVNGHTGDTVVFHGVYRLEFPAHIETLHSFALSLEDGYCQLREEQRKYPTVMEVASSGPRYDALSPERKEQYDREASFRTFEHGFLWNAKHLLTHYGACSGCRRQWGAVNGKALICLCGKKVLLHFANRLTFITDGSGTPSNMFDDITHKTDEANTTDPRDLGTAYSWDEAMGAAADLYDAKLINYVATVSALEYMTGHWAWAPLQLDEPNDIGGHDMLINLATNSPKVYPSAKAFRLFFHWMNIAGKRVGQFVVVHVAAGEKADEIKPFQLTTI